MHARNLLIYYAHPRLCHRSFVLINQQNARAMSRLYAISDALSFVFRQCILANFRTRLGRSLRTSETIPATVAFAKMLMAKTPVVLGDAPAEDELDNADVVDESSDPLAGSANINGIDGVVHAMTMKFIPSGCGVGQVKV